MIFTLNNKPEVRASLQAEGFLPARIGDLFIGDQFVWDSREWGELDKWLVIDRQDKTVGHYDEDTDSVEPNVIVGLTVLGEDLVLHTMTINADHDTWMLQHPENANNPLLYNHSEYITNRLAQAR